MIKQSVIAIAMMAAAGSAFGAQATAEAGATADIAFGQSFTALDTDGDGMVSWAEAKANGISRSAFHSAETTQDNALSQGEYQAARAARDGVVGEAVEIGEDTPAAAEPTYGAMDANKDGQVSKSEFRDYYMASGIYESWDVNQDGMVDQDEFVDVLYIFYDDNGDGYINDAEWQNGLMVDDYGDNGLWDL